MIKNYIRAFREAGIIALAKMSEQARSRVLQWAQGVVEQYRAYLKESRLQIKSAVNLPHPKENIKIAIKTLLPACMATESDENLDLMKDMYIRLSEFQEISQEDIETICKEADEIAQKPNFRDTSLFPKYHRYLQLKVSEQKLLIDEINSIVSGFRTQIKGS